METNILSQNIQFSVSTFCITIIILGLSWHLIEAINKLIFRDAKAAADEWRNKLETLEMLEKEFETKVSNKANEITLEIQNEKDDYVYKLNLIESLLDLIASLSRHTPEHRTKIDYYKRNKFITEMSNIELKFMIDDIKGLLSYHNTINAKRLENNILSQ